MKNRLIILALGLSPPGTMGGNSKITVEMSRCLAERYDIHFIVPAGKVRTLTDNIPNSDRISIHAVPDFTAGDLRHPISSSRFFARHVRTIFANLAVCATDVVFGCSDFHVDVIPAFLLQREFGFSWLPSKFLFVPFIFENLIRGYRFPPVKYLLVWLYSEIMFALMKRRATGFVVTNRSDFARFPGRFAGRIFDYYGGVNIEQIPPLQSNNRTIEQSNNLSVVFCSRLHPQKGIDAFLDTWKLVLSKLKAVPCSPFPVPSLSIIGNGEPAYERYLKEKANRLGIADTIEWLGYVNNEAKYKIYAASKLLVHPTVFDNNGMVAAEALCTGLPVVMQDLPALRHVYTTGCVKVPFGDRAAFAAAVVRLLTDPAHYAATAPTPDQLAALRDRWKWESRAKKFSSWLDTLTVLTGK